MLRPTWIKYGHFKIVEEDVTVKEAKGLMGDLQTLEAEFFGRPDAWGGGWETEVGQRDSRIRTA